MINLSSQHNSGHTTITWVLRRIFNSHKKKKSTFRSSMEAHNAAIMKLKAELEKEHEKKGVASQQTFLSSFNHSLFCSIFNKNIVICARDVDIMGEGRRQADTAPVLLQLERPNITKEKRSCSRLFL